jgi:GNAT superfamily N-acetyltransferase
MTVVVDNDIEQGSWPIEFSEAWIEIVYDNICQDYVASLYFDERNPEGTIIENPDRVFELPLPQAYISWKSNGECKEIFVYKDYQRMGIGTKLCAWARSYLLKNDIIFHAPNKMSTDAQGLFEALSIKYGEPYTNPEEAAVLRGYSYWGYLV